MNRYELAVGKIKPPDPDRIQQVFKTLLDSYDQLTLVEKRMILGNINSWASAEPNVLYGASCTTIDIDGATGAIIQQRSYAPDNMPSFARWMGLTR